MPYVVRCHTDFVRALTSHWIDGLFPGRTFHSSKYFEFQNGQLLRTFVFQTVPVSIFSLILILCFLLLCFFNFLFRPNTNLALVSGVFSITITLRCEVCIFINLCTGNVCTQNSLRFHDQ